MLSFKPLRKHVGANTPFPAASFPSTADDESDQIAVPVPKFDAAAEMQLLTPQSGEILVKA